MNCAFAPPYASPPSAGNAVSQARYNSFGSLHWQDGAAPSDFTFTGQRFDGFGLLDYNARYYDSAIGRFVSADTVVPDFGNPQALNRYSYVLNRPLQGDDPSGHQGPICPDQYCQGGQLDPWYPIRNLWYSTFGPDRPSQEITISETNIVLLSQTTVSLEVDEAVGAQVSFAKTNAFDLDSGEYRKMLSVSGDATLSTPEGPSASIAQLGGFARTSNMDNLLGPSDTFSAFIAADDFVQGGLTYQGSTATEDFWPELLSGEFSPAYEQWRKPVTDRKTLAPVTSHTAGFMLGLDAEPNGIEGGVSASPSLNYTVMYYRTFLYPWNQPK